MKHTFILLISALLFCCPVDAQERVIDSTNRSPISAASIFDATGNMSVRMQKQKNNCIEQIILIVISLFN